MSQADAATVLGPAGAIRPSPIPAGAVLFGELTSAFVDGDRLLRFLEERRHSGAVVDAGSRRVQVAILDRGAVIGAMAATAEGTERLATLHLSGPGSAEEHSLTVLTYRSEVAVAIGRLINLSEKYQRMHGAFVELSALLAFLGRERASGAVRITTPTDTGVVLLHDGAALGAYTRQRPELDDIDVALTLAREADAEIDVVVESVTVPASLR